ncbi:MAG TPA: SMP-30/gluconolactonase/LRE family protein [Bryobacteraceae bacterium]|nr:SMP-30/gluconolactonase/LRE family protein [Bryobacteraceae bacterium]
MRFIFLCILAASAVAAQESPGLRVEKIAVGLHYAEGPAWSPDGFLIFSDCPANKLHKLIPGKGDTESADIPGGPIGNAYDAQGRRYTCEFRERRVTRTSKNGKVEVLASRFEGKRLNAPNDIVVRRDGQIFFTDPAFGNQQDNRELDFYGVFHLTPHGELSAIARLQTRPNGIALSPNGKTLYVTDSDARCVRAFDLEHGAAGRVLIDNIPGVPDGIRVDEKGGLWIAAKEIYEYSPQAEMLAHIALDQTPTNLAFGDPDMQSLFITTRTEVYRVRIGVKGAAQY